jgi:hypothetical protein
MFTINQSNNKIVFEYPNGVSIQYVSGMAYTNGLVDIHITVGGESLTKGANWNQSLSLPIEAITAIETFGARVTKKHIYYGKCYVEKTSALSKLKDYMALAQIIVSILNNSK